MSGGVPTLETALFDAYIRNLQTCPKCNIAGPHGVSSEAPLEPDQGAHTTFTTPQSYVDDVFQNTHNKHKDILLRTGLKATTGLYDALTGEGFVMSGKNDVTASHVDIAQTFLKQLKEHEITASSPYEVRHLGVGNRAGRGAARVLKKARFLKSKARIDNIARLAQRNRKAAKLYPTGAWAMRYYSHQATGLPPTGILRAQRDAKLCSGLPKSTCRLTANLVTYGIAGEPSVKARVEQVKEFIRVWDTLDPSETPKITVQFKQLTDEIAVLYPPQQS